MSTPNSAPVAASAAVSRADAAITYALGLAALWLSYSVLRDLATSAGLTPSQAAVWPLCVDGLILVATRAVVTFGDHPARSYAWALLWASAAVSIVANAVHALLPAGAPPAAVVVAVGIVPPISALAVTHLAVVRARVRATSDAPDAPDAPAPDAPADAPQPPAEFAPQPPPAATESAPTPDVPDAPVTHPDAQVDALTHPDDASPATPDAPDAPPVRHFGDEMRQLCVELGERGMSNRAIGQQIGVSESTVRRYRSTAVAP